MSESLYLSPCCKLPTDWVDRATENGRKELEGTLPEGVELTEAVSRSLAGFEHWIEVTLGGVKS